MDKTLTDSGRVKGNSSRIYKKVNRNNIDIDSMIINIDRILTDSGRMKGNSSRIYKNVNRNNIDSDRMIVNINRR